MEFDLYETFALSQYFRNEDKYACMFGRSIYMSKFDQMNSMQRKMRYD